MDSKVECFPAETLQAWVQEIFQNLDVPAQDAAVAAEALVNTSLRGMDTHGIIYTLTYTQDIRKGKITPRPDIRTIQDHPSTALLDGGNGLGMVVGRQAMDLAIAKAGETGSGVVGVRNSTHFGAAAYYAQLASNQGMIGISFSNTPPVMAPLGQQDPVCG